MRPAVVYGLLHAGLAIVIVQHMGPEHASLLVDLLARTTKLPVRWVNHGETLQPDVVYVAPPGQGVTLKKGVLLLHDIQFVTAEALPKLLRELKKRDFKIVHVKVEAEAPPTPDTTR